MFNYLQKKENIDNIFTGIEPGVDEDKQEVNSLFAKLVESQN